MRIVVLSDSHRAYATLLSIVEMQMDTADLFIFLGDGEDDFDNVLALYPNLKYERVTGNCDWYSTYPLFIEKMINGKRVFFTHGHPFGVKHGLEDITREAKSRCADICLFGHTHNQFTDFKDGIHYMNPGAVCDGNYGMIDILPSGIMLIPAHI